MATQMRKPAVEVGVEVVVEEAPIQNTPITVVAAEIPHLRKAVVLEVGAEGAVAVGDSAS